MIGENAAQEIGAAYHGGELNKFTQLVAHAAVGCTSGAVASGDCASGAFGGVVGEIAGEVQQRRIEQRLQRELSDGAISQEEAVAFAEDMRAAGVDPARLASGLGAALGGGEVTAAADAGGTAAQENAFWVPLIMIVGALWTAYDVATTYRDEGGEAVLEQLAVDGAITVAAGGAGKVLYKVGGKVFRSGPKAWQAVKKVGLWKRVDLSKLSKSDLKSYNSLQKRIVEHKKKLAAFKTNPTVRPGMEHLPNNVIKKQQKKKN